MLAVEVNWPTACALSAADHGQTEPEEPGTAGRCRVQNGNPGDRTHNSRPGHLGKSLTELQLYWLSALDAMRGVRSPVSGLRGYDRGPANVGVQECVSGSLRSWRDPLLQVVPHIYLPDHMSPQPANLIGNAAAWFHPTARLNTLVDNLQLGTEALGAASKSEAASFGAERVYGVKNGTEIPVQLEESSSVPTSKSKTWNEQKDQPLQPGNG